MGWKDELSEEQQASTIIQESESLEDFVKTAISAQGMLGNSVRIPSDNASDEDKRSFTDKMVEVGMIPKAQAGEFLKPADAAHYTLDQPPIDAADLGLAQADIDTLKLQAHEMGLSNEMFQGYAAAQIERVRVQKNDARQKHLEANETLRTLWGPDAFDGNRVEALMAIKRWGGIELAKKIDDNPDPDILRAFADIGKQFAEAGLGDLQTPMYTPETREEAQAKLDEIKNNPEHPFYQGEMKVGRAKYGALLAEMTRLTRITQGRTGQFKDSMFG